jgi:hypothetical protein
VAVKEAGFLLAARTIRKATALVASSTFFLGRNAKKKMLFSPAAA